MTVAEQVEARLWEALRDVEDPEIPVSVVGMGLIVSIAYRAEERAVDLELTFTAMGCPAMDFIQEDIRERLLAEPDVDEVRIEVVWDPVWTRSRIRDDARATMRRLAFYRGRLAAMPPFDEVVAAVRADEKALGDPAAVIA